LLPTSTIAYICLTSLSCYSHLVPTATFFFYSHSAHQTPHSFPTRRSSDLIKRDSKLSLSSILYLRRRFFLLSYKHRAERHRRAQDRKSTRLNSSHVSISYAVFCLKKKI